MRLISGLSAGVRYKVSLYAVTSAGVSEPSSRLVYSREQSKRHTHPPTIKGSYFKKPITLCPIV